MTGFLQRLCSNRLLPVAWTLFTIILLCLPGSAFPDENDFNLGGIDQVDKIVHALLFGGIVLFWGFFWRKQIYNATLWRKRVLIVMLVSIAIGIAMEYVQLYFIPSRDFDGYDIIADAGGAVVVALILLWVGAARSV